MIQLPPVVTIASYCIAGSVLVYTIHYSPGDWPTGTDPSYWARVVRAWRHRRAKR